MRRVPMVVQAALICSALVGCGGADDAAQAASGSAAQGEALKKTAAAGSQVAVVARAALAANVGAVMEVRANGLLLGRVEVRSQQYEAYRFSSATLLANGSKVDVAFVNDGVVGGADRNLYVQSIAVDGKAFASTAPQVRYDRGALDGVDTMAGREDLLWNGTLRLDYSGNQALTVRARGSLAGGQGPVMDVQLNGKSLAKVTVANTRYDDYTFNLPDTLPAQSGLDLVFTNDLSAGGEDRNLYIESIKVNGVAQLSTGAGVTYDRGFGVATGADVVPGQEAMLWNGALRFKLAAETGPMLSFSWPANPLFEEGFEGQAPLAPWRFVPGAEFGPGATGGLSLVADGSGGKALQLDYSTKVDCNANGCPVYAAAAHTLKTPVPADNLRFRIKNTLQREAQVFAWVKDGSGQTLLYRPERCPFETAEDAWCALDVDLRLPSMSFGGANNGQLNGNITEVAVVVQALDNWRGWIEGALQFDDVVLSTKPAAVSLARGAGGNPAAAWRGVDFGDTASRLGVSAHFNNTADINKTHLQKAKEAGFRFVRTDLFWDRIEEVRGVYDFSDYDPLLANAKSMGLNVLFIFSYTNAFYRSGALMSTAAEREAYAAYAGAAAAHFKGQGVRFEIWNEENTGADCPGGNVGYWRPRPDAQTYAKLVAATMKAVRAADPWAQVTVGGLVPSFTPCGTEPTEFSFQYIDTLDRAGGLNDVNALGYHAYYAHAEAWGAELHMLKTLLREKGRGSLAVWDTEWGVSSACPDGETPCADGSSEPKRNRQAVRLARRFLVGIALGLPVNVWYDLVDEGVTEGNRDHHFGLYDTQLKPKPALYAMQTLVAASKGRLTGAAPNLPAGLHALRFSNGGDAVYALWVDRGQVQLKVETQGLVQIADTKGKSLPVSGSWTLRETDGPVYLTYR
jgi:hypothetical protein